MLPFEATLFLSNMVYFDFIFPCRELLLLINKVV